MSFLTIREVSLRFSAFHALCPPPRAVSFSCFAHNPVRTAGLLARDSGIKGAVMMNHHPFAQQIDCLRYVCSVSSRII